MLEKGRIPFYLSPNSSRPTRFQSTTNKNTPNSYSFLSNISNAENSPWNKLCKALNEVND